ncbi:hypothetical protein P152DRAFT_166501 [Eremomyces bilateralis CBS 781.70]|uniref:Uncharacterized protein n=1 Tax=Eremomyces bilateralis CBS 781.70 TaxID=1392243 RepID=A0A6G1FTW3_9PEZI|nr:uncharacterized protein P152DRAFT_166501 [Eremomyces bilateralis CBS 781.70]KAF1809237.1 hypothetical protein P152DRAFT_166501 [Eremomyces bilateralis CBS 781.70]
MTAVPITLIIVLISLIIAFKGDAIGERLGQTSTSAGKCLRRQRYAASQWIKSRWTAKRRNLREFGGELPMYSENDDPLPPARRATDLSAHSTINVFDYEVLDVENE